MNKIRVVLADDHKLLREGIASLINAQPDIEVVGDADDGLKALSLVAKLSPDIVIMDIGMPNLNGIDATRLLTVENPNVKVIALSMHSDRRYVIGMLKAGAMGYLLKDCAFDEFLKAIREVFAGYVYLGTEINDTIIKHYIKNIDAENLSFPTLSVRESEMMQLLAEGKSSKDISLLLHVSVKTVETHRQNIMNKLNIHSIAELTKYAIREGLTSVEK
jgi:two-component system, NarL family, response regulator NreC